MYREHFKLNSLPFQESVDVRLFFEGGNRRIVLDELKQVITDKTPLITLIGGEGNGKTMLCRMVEHELPEDIVCVFLPRAVESYEDIVCIITQQLDVSVPESKDYLQLLQDTLAELKARGKRLLLIFDEAEKLYLATLERVRKMLEISDGESGGLQILLAGRDVLLSNLEQLSMCSFKGTEEGHFVLEPLTADETFNYLNYCMQQNSDNETNEIFTVEAAGKIHEMSRGSMRMINVLAEESLHSSSSDTSFLVLLNHVKDSPDDTSIPSGVPEWRSLMQNQQKLILAGAAVIVLIVGIFLFTADPGTSPDIASEDGGDRETPVLEFPPTGNIVEDTDGVATVSVTVDVGEDVETIVQDNIKPAQEEIEDAAETIDVDNILQERLAAGESWLRGDANNKFTVQLMVLEADTAEENLKKKLARPEYREIADLLVVFRKKSSPSVLLVFYGEYSSKAAARKARNSMPLFLRDQHPFPVPVKSAVAKANK